MKKALLAALATMMAADSSDEDKAKAASTLKAYLEDETDDDDKKESKADGDEKKDDEEKTESKADGDDEEKKDDGDDKEKTESKSAASDATVKMASDLVDANKRIEKLEIDRLLDARKDLPDAVRKWCTTQSGAVVKSFLGVAPKQLAKRSTAATQPEGAGNGGPRQGLDGPELEWLNRHMGVQTHAERAPKVLDDGRLEIPIMRPGEWRSFQEKRAKDRAEQAGKPAGKGEV